MTSQQPHASTLNSGPGRVTVLLADAARHEPSASRELLPLVYDELRKLARARLARERPGTTLRPTALVHEAYLRLAGDEEQAWAGRAEFFAAAAEAMRRILIERARRAGRHKRGGGRRRVTLVEGLSSLDPPAAELLALDEALDRLDRHDREMARVAKLRYFAGLTIEETALVLARSPRTAKRLWTAARVWLYRELTRGCSSPGLNPPAP